MSQSWWNLSRFIDSESPIRRPFFPPGKLQGPSDPSLTWLRRDLQIIKSKRHWLIYRLKGDFLLSLQLKDFHLLFSISKDDLRDMESQSRLSSLKYFKSIPLSEGFPQLRQKKAHANWLPVSGSFALSIWLGLLLLPPNKPDKSFSHSKDANLHILNGSMRFKAVRRGESVLEAVFTLLWLN